MINDKDKNEAMLIRNAIRDNMRKISEQLVRLAQLHGGDGYEFQSMLRVYQGDVKGTLHGQAFKVDANGQLEYLPGDDNPDDSQRGTLETTAQIEVSDIMRKLGLK